jgi:hypothetical protein
MTKKQDSDTTEPKDESDAICGDMHRAGPYLVPDLFQIEFRATRAQNSQKHIRKRYSQAAGVSSEKRCKGL